MGRKQMDDKILEDIYTNEFINDLVFFRAYFATCDSQTPREHLSSIAKLGLICNTMRCEKCIGDVG